jgi:chromosome segregation ATPase
MSSKTGSEPHQVSEPVPMNELELYRHLQMLEGQLHEAKQDLKTRDDQLTEARRQTRDIEIILKQIMDARDEVVRQRDNVESHLFGKIALLEQLQKRYDELEATHLQLTLRDSHQETIRHMAEVVHQSHHQSIPGGWWACPRNTCNAAQQALPELVKKLVGVPR